MDKYGNLRLAGELVFNIGGNTTTLTHGNPLSDVTITLPTDGGALLTDAIVGVADGLATLDANGRLPGAQFPTFAQITQLNRLYATATDGGTNQYGANLTQVPAPLSTGQVFWIRFLTGNTGAATLELTLSGTPTGTKSIRKGNGTVELESGDLSGNGVYALVYTGTVYQLINLPRQGRIQSPDGLTYVSAQDTVLDVVSDGTIDINCGNIILDANDYVGGLIQLNGNTELNLVGNQMNISSNDTFIVFSGSYNITGTPGAHILETSAIKSYASFASSLTHGKWRHYTKQGETTTTGTNTSTVLSVALSSGDRMTISGKITAYGTGGITIGGTFMAVCERIGGSAALVGTVDTSVKDNSAGSPTFTVSASGTDIIVEVTGGGENASWLCTAEYQIAAAPVV